MVAWRKPPKQVLKLNVDGAARGNPGHAGGGGLIRDSKGQFVAGFRTVCASVEILV